MTHHLIRYSRRLLVSFIILIFIISLAVANVQATTSPSLVAVDLTKNLLEIQKESGYQDVTLYTVIGKLISIILGILGVVALVIFVAGGFIWMTSGGSETKIETAKKLMSAGIIGIVIVLLAYGISNFVVEQLIKGSGTVSAGT